MPIINTSQGVGGILNSFKSLVEGAERITFVGTPGFCTPFAELLGFVVRDRELAFISSQDFEKARSIFMDYEGMQLGKLTDPHADVVVLLGGLAMPKIGITPEKAKEVARKILEGSEKGKIIGVCFQSAFMKQKWDEVINFDYIINSDLAVEVLEV
ncbi:hypothetical protein SAMN02910340_02026 [Methanosarcina thermophila]|jgi:hypothetical protein|uniref:DUF2124 domain-containing protein n=3 Tax=Methanosarcina thermophila TaxID=2210 RepID=A0A1I7ACN9_METTE|nr:DUF2124 family protein [Methanosarcina thermophila]ALK06215.1 MAG: hypothetical protein AAY43_11630 [Methanosarcina sp. 795]AKB12194.1 hypothetical protein MSTHT_0436 [Methanosarcina thermophila TM-1]AKB14603.1 hypothetical protein MSTHC_0285 [Methanosarcina thermophila CHTI-55]NLU57793.1 DUF2124 family protein [Methanosarcina thermophila]SFT72653.1 hypothetical protein SAMN02910340_02026 [Methanosarcina thermophila]